MKENNQSRRKFIKSSAIATGFTAIGSLGVSHYASAMQTTNNRLPKEVWIAGISQMDLRTNTYEQMIEELIRFMNLANIYNPDVICLPEVFPTTNVTQNYTFKDRVEISEKILPVFARFAKENSCYVICPVYTTENGKVYNSAVIYNRNGLSIGEYRKIYLTEGEIANGLTPGPLTPPVFQTDFGKIGVQICFDILWDESWAKLKEQGAEIVFFPSAFAGGKVVNGKAWQHKYIVVSSTRKNTSKICDITGEVVAQTGIWDKNYFCAPVNLEKVILHLWPYVRQFNDIRKKYGRKVRITNYHEEEWSVIESLSPDVTVGNIMKEFNLRSFEQHKRDAEKAQIAVRANI